MSNPPVQSRFRSFRSHFENDLNRKISLIFRIGIGIGIGFVFVFFSPLGGYPAPQVWTNENDKANASANAKTKTQTYLLTLSFNN